MRIIIILSLSVLISGDFNVDAEVVNTTNADNLVTTASQKTRNKIKIYDLKCVDRDLERTLTWKVDGVPDNLRLIEYVPRFTSIGAGKYYKLHCYKDDARTIQLQKVNETLCKTNVLQILLYSYNFFTVRAKFQDVLTNKTIKQASQKILCHPVDINSKLTAPDVSVTKANKTAMVLSMTLPPLLAEIKDNPTVDVRIQYQFCVYKSGQNCSMSGNKTEHKIGNTPSQDYTGLTPGTLYQVRGWYTVSSSDADLTSEQNVIKAKTAPDPYPSWAKILTVGLTCGLLIMGMSCTFVLKKIYGQWKLIDTESKKSYPESLIQTLDEFQSYINYPTNPTPEELVSNWRLLQRKKVDHFLLPQLTFITCLDSDSRQDQDITVAVHDPSEVPESSCNEESLPTSSHASTTQHAEDEIPSYAATAHTVSLQEDSSSGSEESTESAQEDQPLLGNYVRNIHNVESPGDNVETSPPSYVEVANRTPLLGGLQ